MSGDDTRGDEPRGNGIDGKGHLRDGHLRDGHLRDGHLRKGHLRGNESTLRSIEGGAGGVNVDLNDDSFSVPDLLATDALLDRLGRHETSDGDLRDSVARILDAYALNADPETAGVRPVELPEIDAASAFVAQPETTPHVLLARRRTLTRLGRGTVAAAAVLALLGGTAAAAATGAGSLGGKDTGVSTSFSAQLPGWFPDTVFRAFGGTADQRVERELKQAEKEARDGDEESATARLQNLKKQLGESEVEVDETLAAQVDDTLAQIAAGTLVALPTPTSSPSGSTSATGSPSPSTTTSLADVASTATPSTDDWQIPQKPRTPGSDTATGTPTTAPTTAPSTGAGSGAGSGGSVVTTPPRTTTGSVPNVPVVPVTPSGPVVTPTPTDTPTDSPTTDPTDTPTTGTTPTETTPTTDPAPPTPTDTTPAVVPTEEATTGAPTTEPTTGPAVGQTPGSTPGESPTTTDPIEVVTPTLPVVVEPSPSAGVEPTPGAEASTSAPAGS